MANIFETILEKGKQIGNFFVNETSEFFDSAGKKLDSDRVQKIQQVVREAQPEEKFEVKTQKEEIGIDKDEKELDLDLGAEVKKLIAGGIPRLLDEEEAPRTFKAAVKERLDKIKSDIKSFQELPVEERAERLAFSFSGGQLNVGNKIPKGKIIDIAEEGKDIVVRNVKNAITKIAESNKIATISKELESVFGGAKDDITIVANKLQNINTPEEVAQVITESTDIPIKLEIPKVTEKIIEPKIIDKTQKLPPKITKKAVREFIEPEKAPFIKQRETTILKNKLRMMDKSIKEGKKIAQNEIKAVQNDLIRLVEQRLPLEVRGKVLRQIKNTQSVKDLDKTLEPISKVISQYEEAREISRELAQKRSKIAFIRKISEFNQTVVNEIKKEVGLTKPIRKATDEQLNLMTEKLQERLAFKKERGFIPQRVVEGKIVPAKKKKPEFTENFYQENIPDKKTISEKVSNISTNISKTKKAFTEKLGEFLTPISTQLKNISPELKYRLRKFEMDLNVRNIKDFKIALPFVEKLSKIKDKNDLAILDLSLKNGDERKTLEIINKYGLQTEFKRVRGLLDDMFNRADAVKYDIGYLKDYFPRMVKDFDGYLKYIESKVADDEQFNLIIKAFEEKEMALGRKLTTAEKVNMVNTMVRGYKGGNITLSDTSAMKERKIDIIDKNLNQFYFDINESLLNYIQTMNDAIEARKFFGKELKVDKTGLLHLEDSIGSYIVKLISENKINFEDSIKLKRILEKRFNQKGTSGLVSVIKNLEYIDVLGSVKNTVTQVGDLGFAMYFGKGSFGRGLGTAITPEKIREKFGIQKITREDLGIDNIAQEFTDNDFAGKSAARILRLTGFEKVDAIGKETIINSVITETQRLLEIGDKRLLKELNDIFGKEATQVKDDIKNGRNTENVKLYLFNKIADIQPIALSEMPQKYLSAGNGRIFYMLKTFTIKQFDVFRNEAFGLMSEGIKMKDKSKVVQGFKNLMFLTASLLTFGITADFAKDIMSGKEIDDIDDYVINNMLKFIGLNKYVLDYSTREGVGAAVAKTVFPPSKLLDNALKDFKKSEDLNNLKSIRSIPVVGELYYWWFGGGSKSKTGLGLDLDLDLELNLDLGDLGLEL